MKTSKLVLRIAATLSVGCPVLALAQAEMRCGMAVYPSPTGIPAADLQAVSASAQAGDPCKDGETVYGPTRFERGNGAPVLETGEFTLEGDADVCVIATASDKGKAFLYLDGERTAEPEDFDDGEEIHTYMLSAGSHGNGISLVGKPGGSVEVEIRQLSSGGGTDPGLPAPGEVRIDAETGALDMVNADGTVRLQNVVTDHPLLTANGDGHHDTTELQALTTPLVDLPGKEDGTVAYYLDWQFRITDLDDCGAIDPGLSGLKQINSPTLVDVTWDGTDLTGALLPDGNYAYSYDVNIVDEFGTQYGSITSPGFGIVIDSAPTDYNESADFLGNCDAATDPSACRCPGVDGQPGTPEPNCEFTWVNDLLPELGLPLGGAVDYRDPTLIDKSFITTNQDPVTGRYTVTVDLTEYNAGGLVPKHRGVWPDEDSLRQWVADMTGVPKSTGDSLFNFDYIQLGTSTAVDQNGVRYSMNNFLLDAITDDAGTLRVGGKTTTLAILFNDDAMPPAQFAVTNPRIGDECSDGGDTNGANSTRGKFCAYNTAVPISDVSDLGIYMLRTTLFDIEFNDVTTTQDQICTITVFFQCGVRVRQVPADTLEIEASTYVDNGGDPAFIRTKPIQLHDAVGLSFGVDRGDGEGGVCAKAVATRGGLAVGMHAADGAVPDTCVINGIF